MNTARQPPNLSPNLLNTPAWLQQLQWVGNPVGYMEAAARQHPDIFAASVVGLDGSLVFVNEPQAIQEILTNDRKTFLALGCSNRILSPLLGDYAVIMLDGDRHKRRRQLLMPPFHGERMRAYGQLICQLTIAAFDPLPLDRPFSARTTLQEISLNIIMQAVFGLSEGDRWQHLKQSLVSMLDLFQSPLTSSFLFFSVLQKDLGAWSPWGKFVRERQNIDALIYAEIAERRSQPNGDRIDILSLLMSAQDEFGQPMTDQELRDELMTLLFAGHETTATAMSWALYWVHHLPAVREKLLQELATLGDAPDPTDIFRLPYLTAVCNETLRIYPVAMLTFPRVVQEPIAMLGHRLEPGNMVVGCIYLVHQRDDLYPNPKQFKPERFLDRQFTPYEFMPFGGGARRCIGEALALFEMKLALATILSRYQLALADAQPEYPRRRGVTLAPANGVKMVLTGNRLRQKSSLLEVV
ncbi:MAG: cytochrome P450 [Tildeniella nuda ZEHNDER 1965/U140]|jgi:unspecific monooxygenase|nr:cytochrome P450 [Tildeniella nuda ZEHNDER 1965/U140]